MEHSTYQEGDLILYGGTGVCRITRISTDGPEKGKPYYTLKPLYQDCDIYTPLNGKVFDRPIISREEAERLIDLIPTIQAHPCHSRVIRELAEHYQTSLESHQCEDLVEMTMSIYAKKQWAEEQKRKFGAVDQRFLKRAEDLLFGELAAALDIPRDDVQAYIAQRISGQKENEPTL